MFNPCEGESKVIKKLLFLRLFVNEIPNEVVIKTPCSRYFLGFIGILALVASSKLACCNGLRVLELRSTAVLFVQAIIRRGATKIVWERGSRDPFRLLLAGV